MNHPATPRLAIYRAGALAVLLLVTSGAHGADHKAANSPAGASAKVVDACTLISKARLEQLLGWELRDGKPKDVSPGLSQCEFTSPPKAYIKRRYDNPALPEAAGFSSIVITTFPTTTDTFAQSRRTMGTEGGDIPGVGDGAFLNGPAMIYVRAGSRGFSIRLHVETPSTPAGRTRLREVLTRLAQEAVTKITS